MWITSQDLAGLLRPDTRMLPDGSSNAVAAAWGVQAAARFNEKERALTLRAGVP